MSLGEGNAYDGDGADECKEEMQERDLPPSEHKPYEVEEYRKASGILHDFDVSSERAYRETRDLDELDAERDAYDGAAEHQTGDEIQCGHNKTAKDEPEDIAKSTHN